MSGFKRDRLWMVGGGVAGVVISALAWFMVINPELSNASSLDEQTLASQTQNISLQSKIHRLQADNSNMDALVASLHQARAALPVQTSLAEFTRELTGYASQHGVSVSGITAGEPMALTSPAPAAAAAPASGSAAGSTHAAGSAAAATPAVSTPSAAGRTFALPLTVVVKGSTADSLNFLAAVQGPNRRAALVSGAQLTGDANKRGAAMQLTIQLQLFVTPQPPGPVDELLTRLANPTK